MQQLSATRAVANATPGAIILMHDIHKTSVDAVPCILDAFTKARVQICHSQEPIWPSAQRWRVILSI